MNNNNIILSLPYILIFTPLLVSIALNIIKSRRLGNMLVLITLVFLMVTTVKIILVLRLNENIFVNVTNGIDVIGSNYVVNLKNTSIILGILVTSFFSLTQLNHETFFIRQDNSKFKRTFYSMYFLSLFSSIGILTTYNIFHLFLFMEIFNFTSLNMLSSYLTIGINTELYKLYTNSIFGSFLSCISIFYLSLYFNTNNILSIKQQVTTINFGENLFIVLVMILLIIGFVLNFLMFNIRTIESTKKMSFNMSTTNNIFIDVVIGLYLISYFLFDIFNFHLNKYLLYFLYCVLSGFVLYYSVVILFIKNNSIYNIFFNFVRINIYYCLLGIIIPDPEISSNVMILNILENSIVNLPIYLISMYISEIYHNTNYKLLNEKKYILIKGFLIFLIFFKLSILPNTTSNYSAGILLGFFKKTHNYLMMGILIINKIIVFVFLLKFLFYERKLKINSETFDFNRKRLLQYKVSLTLSFFLVIAFIVIFNKIDWMFII